MTYYFISLDPGRFQKFQRRMDFLSSGIWVDDKDRLMEILAETPEDPFFFLHLQSVDDEVNAWALLIRRMWPSAKLLFVSKGIDSHGLKEHQRGKWGGDAYVHEGVSEELLHEMVENLSPQAKNDAQPPLTSDDDFGPKVNRLDAGPPPQESNNVQSPPESGMEEIFSDLTPLKKVLEHPLSKLMDQLFIEVLQLKSKKGGGLEIPDIDVPAPKPKQQEPSGEDMSDKDQELSLDGMQELEIGFSEDAPASEAPADAGLDLSLDGGAELSLTDEASTAAPMDDGLSLDTGLEIEMGKDLSLDELGEGSDDAGDGDDYGEVSLGEEDGLSLDDGDDEEEPVAEGLENIGELDLSFDAPPTPVDDAPSTELSLTEDDGNLAELSLGGDELSLDGGLDLGGEVAAGADISDDARKKLEEIDSIMEMDASQVDIMAPRFDNEESNDLAELSIPSGGGAAADADLDQPLVSEDLNLDSLSFGAEPEEAPAPKAQAAPKKPAPAAPEESISMAAPEAEKPKKKKREVEEDDSDVVQDFKEISGAYSGELERTQATISNLRADRQELLTKIQQLEEEKLVQSRQNLTLRAELDERKIELTIIRKKLNEEITELKDRMRLQDERKLILEEKNRVLTQELDKAGQRNKIDLKKVQMRERELEQKLELLKADAETQIKNRDLKILELKRKIDAMEFDMESISQQEKKSVESRSELEDKLDKAIKTLRTAITVLEDESDRGSALNVLKKNIDV